MNDFKLDPRLAADTLPVAMLQLCEVRLMNDARWPWLVLVPQRHNAVENHDLEEQDQALLARETSLAAAILKELTGCEKINSAALGNIVRQLHVHVLARSSVDPNWPGPVWGFGARGAYEPGAGEAFIEKLRAALLPKIL